MKRVLSRKVQIALVLLVIAYAFCLELCARESAALVMLGAGTHARASAVVAMVLLLALRLTLFVFMPAYLAARFALYALAPPHGEARKN